MTGQEIGALLEKQRAYYRSGDTIPVQYVPEMIQTERVQISSPCTAKADGRDRHRLYSTPDRNYFFLTLVAVR